MVRGKARSQKEKGRNNHNTRRLITITLII
jgi:hypothetical protein